MKSIPQYDFYRTKYGEELLIDLIELNNIKKYIEIDPVHTLSYFDITFIEEGRGFFSVNEKQYMVSEGDVIFSMPGEIRSWDKDHIEKGYALIFEEEFLLSFFNDPLFLQHLSYFFPHRVSAQLNISCLQPRINNLIQQIFAEIQHYDLKDKHLLRAYLYEMLILLNREFNRQFPLMKDVHVSGDRYIDAFVTLVKTDCKTFHHTTYYADQLCITSNYLNGIIKKSMGINAKSYIRNQLLLEAKKLLTYTNHSIDEIADLLHFESTSYFIRFFRNHTNCTPLFFRKTNKER